MSATGKCFGPVIVLPVHLGASFHSGSWLIGYANDSTLSVVPSTVVKVTVAETLNSHFGKVSERCDLWVMKFKASKTKTTVLYRSPPMHPQSPPLTIGGTVLKESDDLDIFGATVDSKMTFEKYLCSVSTAASQRLVILKSWRTFHDRLVFGSCFRGFVQPVLEFCSAVWYSAADKHTLNYWTL